MKDLLLILGLALIGIGIIIALLTLLSSIKGRALHGGGLILIGPIPIIIGSDKRLLPILIAIASIFILLTVLLFLLQSPPP